MDPSTPIIVMESSKLAPKNTPALFEKLDCTRRSTFTKTRRECVYCDYRGMLEMLSHADPHSSGRKIDGRHNLGHMYELSVAEQLLLILQLPRTCEPIAEVACKVVQ